MFSAWKGREGKMDIGGKYLNLSPAGPWPGRPVFAAEGPGGKKYFIREASRTEAGAAPYLSHPVLPAYVETLAAEGKTHIVYEHFSGTSAAAAMESGGTFSELEALKTGYDIAGGIKYLHGLSPRVVHGGVSPGAVFRTADGRVFLCGCAAAGEPAADLKGLAGLLRAFAAAPKTGRFSDAYYIMLGSLEEPGLEAGHALKIIESLGTRPLFQAGPAPRKLQKGKLPLYAWPLAAAVLFAAFFLAFKFRIDYWPQLRARRNITLATELARSYPCATFPAPRERTGYGENLLFNPGLEGPCGWQVYGGFTRSMIKKGGANTGGHYFMVKSGDEGVYQDVDISQYSSRIGAGGCKVRFSGYLKAGGAGGDGEPYLYGYAMRTANDYTYLSGFNPVSSKNWVPASYEWQLPAGANKVRIFLNSSSYKRGFLSKKAYFDNISVEVNCP